MEKILTKEKAIEYKTTLSCAWGQVHEFTKRLEEAGFEVGFISTPAFIEKRMLSPQETPSVLATKVETITL